MPLVLVTVGAAVGISLLRGGRLSRVTEARLERSWLLFAGLLLQVGVDAAAARSLVPDPWPYAALAVSQVLVLLWVAANRQLPGMPLVATGLLLNAAVIGANGAMPVSREAIEQLGIGWVSVAPGKHEPLTAATRLPWLADVHALPPIRTIVSLGDVVLAAGLVPLVHDLLSVERRTSPAFPAS